MSGVEKILNKTSKNPQENTLDKILLFLESKVLGSNLSTAKNNKAEEPQEAYNSQTMEEVKNNPLEFHYNKSQNIIIRMLTRNCFSVLDKMSNFTKSNRFRFPFILVCNFYHQRKTFRRFFSGSNKFDFNFHVRDLFVKMSQNVAFCCCKCRKL